MINLAPCSIDIFSLEEWLTFIVKIYSYPQMYNVERTFRNSPGLLRFLYFPSERTFTGHGFTDLSRNAIAPTLQPPGDVRESWRIKMQIPGISRRVDVLLDAPGRVWDRRISCRIINVTP